MAAPALPLGITDNVQRAKHATCNIQLAKHATCICLVETWIDKDHLVNPRFDDKRFVDASLGKGKGCCAFIPPDSQLFCSHSEDTYQLISFLYKEKIQVTVIYISQNGNTDSLAAKVKTIMDNSYQQCVIGDFNFSPDKKNLFTNLWC